MYSEPPLFEFRQVGVSIDDVVRLENLSFSAFRGEFVLLHGATGSGKTLVLEMLSGLRKPTEGEVIVAGDRINDYNELERRSLRRSMGLLMQGGLLLEDRSVLENVLIPAVVAEESFREARARARIALEKCGLAALADLRPHELSAGQRQLAMLARAVVNRPALILADEPAAQLDDRNAQTLIDLLGMFAQAGVTVFLASHRIPRPRNVKVRVIELDAAARRE
ncbi:MAG TPA: ATP-binding cassette domain-containing protein [Candidatus Sutterella merdavium]|nr:ATP-binding cassette domain-containing protein [Candidatus Sutterella merdavium]